ncbi:hypothetical protein FisN_4Lh027 [Fistulifera solaris]|uniref:DUF1736 domain-containing protein n=1 Tax=Fistulifera solaris TaxID=1519565 RepID=A0A1Z5KD90_FISSO|nr:hypothetical protein FisN_4Lh027 [Fistulifera solaris]|eukprot:GAX24270.1 hypothetical protein FisN_4Lh027 [Fistulifera solaris]
MASSSTKSLFLRKWILRPSIWACIISILAYWDHEALHGSLVYDDAGSLKSNPVVTGAVPWTEVATRDFWGTPMATPQSHKSFRPITTLTFRFNWLLSEHLGTNGTDTHTIGFHVVNVGLHGIVTGLVTESAAMVFEFHDSEANTLTQLLTGILFALHPVHAEAVSNITSRGELLMSLFFLLAFLSFSSFHPDRRPNQSRWKTLLFVYTLPWFCMTVSLFCKEQGATALITITIWDFLVHHSSLKEFLSKLQRKQQSALNFTKRTTIFAFQTLLVVALRYWLNGESSPDFIFDQNPAGFSEDRFTRVFSICWVYCLYLWDAVYPSTLCPDWSGKSIDLISDIWDPRVPLVVALWVFALGCLLSVATGLPLTVTRRTQHARCVFLVAFFAFVASPFLLSSNLLIVVGLMKADRVIYLPLMGFCMIEALLVQLIYHEVADEGPLQARALTLPGNRLKLSGYILLMFQLFVFAAKVYERNVAWSHSLNLWRSAFEINSKSQHTRYNCGYELSLKKRYEEAEQVLRPIADPYVESPSTSFVYAMVLFNLGHCEDSLKLIDEAFYAVDERRRQGGVRNSEDKLVRMESNLLVAQAYCTSNTAVAGKLMYDAVQVDRTNAYAVEQASEMVRRLTATHERRGLIA